MKAELAVAIAVQRGLLARLAAVATRAVRHTPFDDAAALRDELAQLERRRDTLGTELVDLRARAKGSEGAAFGAKAADLALHVDRLDKRIDHIRGLIDRAGSVEQVRHGGVDRVVRAAADVAVDSSGVLEGYAATFGVEYEVRDHLGHYMESIEAGSMAASLRRHTPIFQSEHGRCPSLGVAPIAKLRSVTDTREGLHFVAEMFDVPATALIREGLRSGAISGASFRSSVPPGGDVWSKHRAHRTIGRCDVHELGP